MDSDANLLERHWERAKSFVRTTWDKLTDDDVLFVNGSAERLSNRLVSRYGYTRAQAHAECHAFAKRFGGPGETTPAPEHSAPEHRAFNAMRETSITNPGGAQAIHPPRSLADGLNDALGGGTTAAPDF